MHRFVPQIVAIGLAAQSARRQPKNNCDFDKRRHLPARGPAKNLQNHAWEAQATACAA